MFLRLCALLAAAHRTIKGNRTVRLPYARKALAIVFLSRLVAHLVPWFPCVVALGQRERSMKMRKGGKNGPAALGTRIGSSASISMMKSGGLGMGGETPLYHREGANSVKVSPGSSCTKRARCIVNQQASFFPFVCARLRSCPCLDLASVCMITWLCFWSYQG